MSPTREAEDTMYLVLFGKLSAQAVLDYCKEVLRYLAWVQSLGRDPKDMGPVMICGYLQTCLSRGKSVPTRVRCALGWFESHAKMVLNTTGVEIRDFTDRLVVKSGKGQAKKIHHAPPIAGGPGACH